MYFLSYFIFRICSLKIRTSKHLDSNQQFLLTARLPNSQIITSQFLTTASFSPQPAYQKSSSEKKLIQTGPSTLRLIRLYCSYQSQRKKIIVVGLLITLPCKISTLQVVKPCSLSSLIYAHHEFIKSIFRNTSPDNSFKKIQVLTSHRKHNSGIKN
jgi:hypothetical protein